MNIVVVEDEPNLATALVTYSIGDHVDATSFDPETKLAFNSLGEGSIVIFHQDFTDQYTSLAKIPTAQGAKTMALDIKMHRVYVPAMETGQFEILVFQRAAKTGS
jgi:hypothetical protein